jgi:hypothetical protein
MQGYRMAEEFRKLQDAKAELEAERFDKITTTLDALVIVLRNKLAVTEADWKQAVDEATNRR